MLTGNKTYFLKQPVLAIIISILFIVIFPVIDKGKSYEAKASSDVSNHKDFLSSFTSYTQYIPYKPMPEELLIDEEGNEYLLSDMTGRFLLINLWAIWCAPCINEIPSLLELQQKAGEDRLAVIFISMDAFKSKYSHGNAKERLKLPDFRSFYAKNTKIWASFSIKWLPTTLLISPKGEMMYKFTGDTDWRSQLSVNFIINEMNNATTNK
jgi:thiol-disulfide isomerase/thioredoxin